MIRECTDYENCILKESKADMLTYPEYYAFVDKHHILPYLLGCGAGLGLGALIAYVLPDTYSSWRYFIFAICIAGAISLFDLIGEWIAVRKSRKAPLPGKKFRVNGGVILDYVIRTEGNAHLIIAEDDLRDAEGNPVCIEYPAPRNLSVTAGQRILLAYSDNGAYIPLRLTAQTDNMIPSEPPAYFHTVDWEKATRLPHPAAMNLDKESYLMHEKEVEDFAKACTSLTDIRVKNWVGIIILSLLVLFLLGLLLFALIVKDVITKPFAGALAGAVFLLAWGIFTVVMAKRILTGVTRGLKRLQYKKKVMFLSVYREYGFNEVYMSYVRVYEYVDGELLLRNYFISNSVFLPKDIPYGKVIYKLSKASESTEKDLNYFSQDDFVECRLKLK